MREYLRSIRNVVRLFMPLVVFVVLALLSFLATEALLGETVAYVAVIIGGVLILAALDYRERMRR